MDIYEMILEALQYQVDNNYLTIEEAEEVNDLAYDRYVSEGNAFNKLNDKRLKEVHKLDTKYKKYESLKNDFDYNPKAKEIYDKKLKDLMDKGNDLNSIGVGGYAVRNRMLQDKNNEEARKWTKGHNYVNIPKTNESNELRRNKKDWMKFHGDKGTRPEEKYKAGRYLRAHQINKSIED